MGDRRPSSNGVGASELPSWKVGRMEGGKVGRLERWKVGGLEGRRVGREDGRTGGRGDVRTKGWRISTPSPWVRAAATSLRSPPPHPPTHPPTPTHLHPPRPIPTPVTLAGEVEGPKTTLRPPTMADFMGHWHFLGADSPPSPPYPCSPPFFHLILPRASTHLLLLLHIHIHIHLHLRGLSTRTQTQTQTKPSHWDSQQSNPVWRCREYRGNKPNRKIGLRPGVAPASWSGEGEGEVDTEGEGG
jgi:hypothetical protein